MTWLYRSTDMKSTTSTVPGCADPAEVVAAEVDEHQVLGALLGVGEQVGGERRVLLGRVAPRHRVPAIGCIIARPSVHLDQRLRAGADDVEAVEAEQVHVRARVGRAQHPVDVERVGVGGHRRTAG